MFAPSLLWSSPQVNPINHKARSVPLLNPISVYGRVFFFSWFGFFVAFWSWYAFPPLLSDVIAKDLKISKNEVLNSNIIALVATLLVRLIAGPCCDRFGPRWTFAGTLIIGAIPTFLAGTIHSAGGLYAVRFFVGVLGGSFVPCQVWTTGFFDKNVIGTANSLTAGFGNAGGGVTYFLMPAIYNSLVRDQGESSNTAWRVAFVVPGIVILVTATALILLCPDTPTGKWADRTQVSENNLRRHGLEGQVVAVPGTIGSTPESKSGTDSTSEGNDEEKKLDETRGVFGEHEAQMSEQKMMDTARGEVIQKPSFKQVARVIFSPQTLTLGAVYFCSFGSELSINSILGSYYGKNFAGTNLQSSGNLAAIFGLMNIIFRPLGGVVSDLTYKRTGTVWSKKVLLHSYVTMQGVFLIIIGILNPHSQATLVGLVSGGLAFFLEGSNGLTYSIVPHVHPHANGVVSGFAGAMGNFGGIIFAIIFRYNGTNYGRVFYIIGAICIGIQVLTCWIKPIPKGQIGGR